MHAWAARVLFTAAALDVLSLEHVLRTIAGRVFGGGKCLWRLLLLSGTFALGFSSLLLRHGKFLKTESHQPVWGSLWWLESLIRTAILSTLIGMHEQWTASPQTVFSLWGALILTVAISIVRL